MYLLISDKPRVPIDRLMNMAELAEHFGVTRGAVWNWQSRHENFPKPLLRDLYDVLEVKEWRECTYQ